MENKGKVVAVQGKSTGDKFGEAIGLFWGAALFLAIILVVIMIVSFAVKLLFAVVVGIAAFLFIGLVVQGVITLFKKN